MESYGMLSQSMAQTIESQGRMYRHLGTIGTVFTAVLLISNIVSTKIVDFKWFAFDGGTLLFPLSYVFGDILTEVYGFRAARRVIWLGFFCSLLMSLMIMLVGALPPGGGWENQSAYDAILGLTPRLVVASLIAYAAGEFSNSVILAKMKVLTQGRWLWTRTIGSTMVGELVDSALFVCIAFWGLLPNEVVLSLIVSNYVFKMFFEIVLTPVTYAVVGALKRSEHEDYDDTKTVFNPFSIK